MERCCVREHTGDSQMYRGQAYAKTLSTLSLMSRRACGHRVPTKGRAGCPRNREQICLAGASREGGRRRNRPREARPDALAL